jgi:hypothetical protein
MAVVEVIRSADKDTGVFTNPWPAVLIGLAASSAAAVLQWASPGALGWARFVLIGMAGLAAGNAVAVQPGSSKVLALAALASFLAGQGTEWDSARLVFRVLAAVAGFSAILLLFSSKVRRVVVSVLIVIHFGGILTAVASPSGGWVANQLWAYVYRPYLQFMYLNNAYHFYAPEPGPTPMLWFCIEYEPDPDGSRNLRWVKVPNMDKDRNSLRADGTALWPKLEATRRLSLAESANYPGPQLPQNVASLLAARIQAGGTRIPLPSDLSPDALYREPNDVARMWIRTYVRHVANSYKHQMKPDLEVIGVKVYRVTHAIIPAPQLAEGMRPDDPILYFPYFMGDFDKDGKMKPSPYRIQVFDPIQKQVKLIERDPFLYTLIPIMRPAADPHQAFRVNIQQKVKNFVLTHAGDVDEGDLP